jgi:hypothetical protein
VLEDILREVQGYIPDRVRACDGKRVLELERLPLDLLLDEFGRGAVPFLPVASTCSFGFSRMVTGPRRQPPIRGSDRLASCLFGNQMEAVFR